MNRRHALKALAGLMACPVCMSLRADAWDYENQAAWGGVCVTGSRQSPVNIWDTVPADLPPLQFQWNQPATKIQKNTETVKVFFSGGTVFAGKFDNRVGTEWTLLQMHFHHKAEHRIRDVQAEMEAHFVHSGPGGLGVVAVLMNPGGSNLAFARTMQQMPAEETEGDEGTPITASIDPMLLLPGLPQQQPGNYFQYQGSLTTPTGTGGTCTENVTWMVLEQPIRVDGNDIAKFRAKFSTDARDWQRKSLLNANGQDVSVKPNGTRTNLTVQRSTQTWDRPCLQVGDAWLCL